MRLQEWRQRKLKTMRDVAAEAKVGLGTIHAIEHGQRLPGLRTIKKLSEALEVDPLEIDEFRAVIENTAPRKRKAAK